MSAGKEPEELEKSSDLASKSGGAGLAAEIIMGAEAEPVEKIEAIPAVDLSAEAEKNADFEAMDNPENLGDLNKKSPSDIGENAENTEISGNENKASPEDANKAAGEAGTAVDKSENLVNLNKETPSDIGGNAEKSELPEISGEENKASPEDANKAAGEAGMAVNNLENLVNLNKETPLDIEKNAKKAELPELYGDENKAAPEDANKAAVKAETAVNNLENLVNLNKESPSDIEKSAEKSELSAASGDEKKASPEDANKAAGEAGADGAENADNKNTENAENVENAENAGEKSKSAKKKKPEKSPREPIDWAAVFAAFAAFCAGAWQHFKVFMQAAAVCSGKIFRRLGNILQNVGANAWSLLLHGTKSAGKAMAWGFAASVKRTGEVGSIVLPAAVRTLASAGKAAWDLLIYLIKLIFGVILSFLSAVFGVIFGWVTKKFRQPLMELWCFLITPFAHFWGGTVTAWNRIKKGAKRGLFPFLGAIIHAIWDLLGAIIGIFRFAFNYIAPAVCLMFLIGLIRYASTLQYAISVNYNGSDIGTIENEATYNEAQTLIQDKVTFTGDDSPILVTPTFSVTVINMDESEKQPTDDIDTLSETMIEQGDVEIVYAYGLNINGELYGVYTPEDMETIRAALEARLNRYSRVDAVNVSYEDEINFTEGRFISDVLTSPDGALDLINGGTDVEAYYSVQKGDTISGVCEKLGISEEDFEQYNPGVEKISRNDIITYHYIEPYLNVLTTYYEAYDQVIERTTEYVETSRREQYCEILLQHGSDGYENVTALVTLTNGKETDRTVVSRTVLEEMVPRKFRVGTKENTYLNGDTTIIDKLGTFCWPLGDEDCYISTMPGWRAWDHSNHLALDIAGIPRGTDIYAACDGKVTFAGRSGAYGELVIVDCGSGYECYYAHCSKLLVEAGDRVEKGDTIAEVGMTGSASGNHLHFEMRHNGERINPLKALGGTGGHEIRE